MDVVLKEEKLNFLVYSKLQLVISVNEPVSKKHKGMNATNSNNYSTLYFILVAPNTEKDIRIDVLFCF